MKKKEFVGIDLSKEKMDVRLHLVKQEEVFDNTKSGHRAMKQWIAKQVDQDTTLLFCFEHTGMYGFRAC